MRWTSRCTWNRGKNSSTGWKLMAEPETYHLNLAAERNVQLAAFLEETRLLGMLEQHYLEQLNETRLKRVKTDDFIRSLLGSVPPAVHEILMAAHMNEISAVYNRRHDK